MTLTIFFLPNSSYVVYDTCFFNSFHNYLKYDAYLPDI